ncbi:MAG: S-adenosylmethionine decarboxylase [Acidobacteriota bacterium]
MKAVEFPRVDAFGFLLALDLYQCERSKLDSIDYCSQLLEHLVSRLRMHKQAPPYVFRSPEEFPDKAGLSGWVPLIESGISIHTIVPSAFASIDIYCCSRFPVEPVSSFLCDELAAKHVDSQILVRGPKYPDGDSTLAGTGLPLETMQ